MPSGSDSRIDQNFDAEYKQIHQLAGDSLKTMSRTQTTLDNGINRFQHVTMTYLYDHPDDLDAMQSTLSRASNVLNGCAQFLKNDVYVSQKKLRDSLSAYSKLVQRMLKENDLKPEAVTGRSSGANYEPIATNVVRHRRTKLINLSMP